MTSLSGSTSSPHGDSGVDPDHLLLFAVRSSGAVAIGILGLILLFLVWEASPAMLDPGIERFINDPSWHPTEGQFDLKPMFLASIVISFGAVALAAPAGIASAVFVRYYAPPWLAVAFRSTIEVFAGMPSVVLGLWGLMVVVPRAGAGILAAVIVLALMIHPTVALLSEASLRSLPPELRQGAEALGLSRWRMILQVLLPAARGGVATAVLLAAARALGETMAVLMVAGNVVMVPTSVLDPARTLTANIALEMAYATGTHRSALFFTGLVLTLVVAGLVLASTLSSEGEKRLG